MHKKIIIHNFPIVNTYSYNCSSSNILCINKKIFYNANIYFFSSISSYTPNEMISDTLILQYNTFRSFTVFSYHSLYHLSSYSRVFFIPLLLRSFPSQQPLPLNHPSSYHVQLPFPPFLSIIFSQFMQLIHFTSH